MVKSESPKKIGIRQYLTLPNSHPMIYKRFPRFQFAGILAEYWQKMLQMKNHLLVLLGLALVGGGLLSACSRQEAVGQPLLSSATPVLVAGTTPVINFEPVDSATPGATYTASITPTVTVTFVLPSATPQPTLPPEHSINGVPSDHQYFALGCEARAAVDWAAFFGVDINEFNFQYQLPLSDNPDKGFVGDVNGPWGQIPPYAYGVNAGPVADLLQTYGLPAQAGKNLTTEQVKAQLAQDHPVIAWVIGNMVGGTAVEYTDQAGDTTLVAPYEHVVLLTGYDEENIHYVTNGKRYYIPYEYFERSWGVLGNMAVYYEAEK